MFITLESPVRSVPQAFAVEQQVIAHLPYGMGGRLIPVVGVVVTPGSFETVIRIRDRDQNVVNVAVQNNQLESRG